jgi:conjugative transfer region protein (TIGR03750 family)
MSESEDILASRLDSEPNIFRGCSSSELLAIVAIAIAVWFPINTIVASMLGAVTMGIGATALGVLLTVLVMATLFQRIKRGRPDGYYQHLVSYRLNRLGITIFRFPFVSRSGVWDLGRTSWW